MITFKHWTGALLAVLWMVGAAQAEDLIYQPVNPNFGGNSFNAAPLLNNAQVQNKFEDPRVSARSASREQSFEERVDGLALSSVARAILGNITDPTTGNLVPGIINTGLSTIEVTDDGTNLTVTVTDNATGDSTTFTSPSP